MAGLFTLPLLRSTVFIELGSCLRDFVDCGTGYYYETELSKLWPGVLHANYAAAAGNNAAGGGLLHSPLGAE